MVKKRMVCMFLACVAVIGSYCIPAAGAVGDVAAEAGIILTRATGKFDVEIPGDTLVKASSSFPLESGETVTINAAYSPRTASVDFGLIGPDGLFHPVAASNGSFNETFEVGQRGYYTFAIRNNSAGTVSVTGFVNY